MLACHAELLFETLKNLQQKPSAEFDVVGAGSRQASEASRLHRSEAHCGLVPQ